MFSETIELRGHIIDSLILPKVLDEILKGGGNFKIAQVKIGHQGVRVVPAQRATSGTDVFQLLNTNISAERPKGVLIREIARELEEARKSSGKILIVAGASVVHTGAAGYLVEMINGGYVDLIISGNALAVYDIESALFGTALGLNLERDGLSESGHENHLRAINVVRAAGGISRGAEAGKRHPGVHD